MTNYHVEHMKNKSNQLLNDAKALDLLQKWSLSTGLHMSSWAFNEPYDPLRIKCLICSVLKGASLTGPPLPELSYGNLMIEPVPCTLTSMEFFDRLLDPSNGVVSRSGDDSIRGCFEELIDEIVVGDELRQMLLNEASDLYPLYSRAERRELLFRLLQHLALGGQWCQYEDSIRPYIDMAVRLYKALLNVQKDRDGGDVLIRSKCFRVVLPDLNSIQDFVYILIDPGLREITVFAHKF